VSVDALDAPSAEILQMLVRQKEDSSLAQWVEDQFKKCKQARMTTERQWYLNLSFYFGRQYVQFYGAGLGGTTSIKLVTPKAPPWRVRMVVNRVRPIIRTEISKLTAQKPTVYVIPASGEDQDKAAARVGEQIWESAYRDLEVHKLIRRSLWWGTICGNSYIKSYWDQSGEQGMGAVKMEVVSPFHVFVPDLTVEEIEEQPYLIHSTVKDIGYVKRTYGIDVNPSQAAQDEIIDQSFMNIQTDSNVNKKDSVLCHEVWIKPGGHKLFPAGGLLTVIGGQIVQRLDSYPYLHGEFPFAKFDHVQTGKYYSDSVVTDLVPLQRELNRTRSQIIEAKNLMAKPQLLAPKGSVDPRKITSEPGQVIQYQPGLNPPTPLPLQSLPSYVLQEVDRLVQDMDDVSGQHEITRGQNPSQVTAYSALSYLQGQDESKLASSIASVEEYVEKVARLYLKYVVYFWDLPRTVRTVGRDKMVDAAAWKGSDLRGNTDIRVEHGSAIPLGKEQKRAFLLDLFKLGAIDPSMLFELLDMTDINDANSEFLVDKQQATRENILMSELGEQMPPEIMQPTINPMTGQEIPPQIPQIFLPHSYDNHEAHIAHHNNFRKSQEFDAATDIVKQLFENHVMLHQYALMGGSAPSAGMMPGEQGPPIGGQQQEQQAIQQQEQPPPAGGETKTESQTQPKGQGN
jgi:hypothetical protein